MTRQSQAKKTAGRKRYSEEFKPEALALAERLGVPIAQMVVNRYLEPMVAIGVCRVANAALSGYRENNLGTASTSIKGRTSCSKSRNRSSLFHGLGAPLGVTLEPGQ